MGREAEKNTTLKKIWGAFQNVCIHARTTCISLLSTLSKSCDCLHYMRNLLFITVSYNVHTEFAEVIKTNISKWKKTHHQFGNSGNLRKKNHHTCRIIKIHLYVQYCYTAYSRCCQTGEDIFFFDSVFFLFVWVFCCSVLSFGATIKHSTWVLCRNSVFLFTFTFLKKTTCGVGSTGCTLFWKYAFMPGTLLLEHTESAQYTTSESKRKLSFFRC